MSSQESRAIDTADNAESSNRPVKKRRTNVGKACEPCRRRRCKCDGVMPSCTTCAIYKDECFWDPREDYRKPLSRQEIKALSTRVQDLERVLRDHGISFDREGNGTNPKYDELDRKSNQDGSESANEVRQWSQDHLVEGETGDLRVYGPTSAFRHLGKYSHERIGGGMEVNCDSPPGSPGSSQLGYAKHLPLDVFLPQAQHDIAMDRFFRYYASWGQRTNPILFMREMHVALYTPANTKTPHYSPMLHNAILAIALGFSDESYFRSPATRKIFANKAKGYIDHEGMRPTIATVQALAHLASYHSLAAEHNLGWLYIGMALRCGVALGLNIDDARMLRKGTVSPDQARERNVTFWTTFVQEGVWAPYIGRSITLPEYTTLPPTVDEDLDQLPWQSHEYVAPRPLVGAQPGMVSTTFVQTVKLMKIGERIMNTLYGLKTDMSTLVQTGVVHEMSMSLSAWHEKLPATLKIHGDSPSNGLPHILMLHLSYAWLVILLHRPFYRPLAGVHRVKKGKDALAANETATWAVQQCDTAALHVISLLHTWHRLHDLRFSPPTAQQCCFIAGTTHLLTLASAQTQDEQAESLDNARQCIDLLRLMAVSWPAAQQKQTLLENLVAEYGLSVVSQRSNHQSPALVSTALPLTDETTPISQPMRNLAAKNAIIPPASISGLAAAPYPTLAPFAPYSESRGEHLASHWDLNSGNAFSQTSQMTLAASNSQDTLLPGLSVPAEGSSAPWEPYIFDSGMGELDPETQALLDNILRPHLDVGVQYPESWSGI